MAIIITFRNVVRQMMVAVDPVGVRLRKNQLVRRKYSSKVIIYLLTLHGSIIPWAIQFLCCINFHGL